MTDFKAVVLLENEIYSEHALLRDGGIYLPFTMVLELLNKDFYLDEAEHSILLKSLVQMKNKLIQQGRFTDCVDDLIMKVIAAPMRRI